MIITLPPAALCKRYNPEGEHVGYWCVARCSSNNLEALKSTTPTYLSIAETKRLDKTKQRDCVADTDIVDDLTLHVSLEQEPMIVTSFPYHIDIAWLSNGNYCTSA